MALVRIARELKFSPALPALGVFFFLSGFGVSSLIRRRSSSSSLHTTSDSTLASKIRKKSTLYTKTGDQGTSSLYNGERRSKKDLVFEALGCCDELNAQLGIAAEYCEQSSDQQLTPMLVYIQSRLFDLGASIATPPTSSEEKLSYTEEATGQLEMWIDELDSQLPPLTNFVIPSGGLQALHLNLARTIARRSERQLFHLIDIEMLTPEAGKFMNRLSDFLFAAGRVAAMKANRKEKLWIKTMTTDSMNT